MFKAGFDTTEIPFSWVLEYCKWDVHVTHLLYQSQMRKLTPELLAVVYARCLLTPVLADIEFNGMAIDVTRVTQMIEEKTRECNELTALFLAEFGTENVNGTIEKQRLLFDELGFGIPTDPRTKRPMLTPTGRPQTNEDAIRRLRPSNARQRRFLELYTKYKQLHSELTKYLNTFAECAASSGILRGEFHQARTRTHRLSSSGLDYSVQFQNLPRAYKSLFVPKRKGWRMGEADGSQLEFRVAAHLGRDDTALEHIVSGVDIHARTASIIGCTRQEAKAHSFKPLYGGSSGTQAERNYYETFKRTYKGIASSQQEWLSHVLTHKQLETEWGLIYYWPDTHRTSSGYITNTTSIYNYPVQALATAEIIPLTLIAMWHTLKRSQYKMEIVNTIHDSIVVELPPEEEEVFHELTREAFTVTPYELLYKLYGVQFSVPLGSESKCGDAWGQGTGRKYQASEDLYTWQI
jgi:DNA polymerase-1